MVFSCILVYPLVFLGRSFKYFSPGVNRTEFHNILMVGRSDVGVLTSYKHVILSPPTVSLDLLGSALCGLYATTIRP